MSEHIPFEIEVHCQEGQLSSNDEVTVHGIEMPSASMDLNSDGASSGQVCISKQKYEAKVFFSYSSKDVQWVNNTVKKLETEHGINCIFDERDFVAGKPIVDNIIDCIRKTEKTVLVLSTDFTNSPWCGYEAQMVLSEQLIREKKLVIPVLLSECNIPDFISHLTYLDVYRDPYFWEKFLEILSADNSDDGRDEVLLNKFSFESERDKFNGQSILRMDSSSLLDTNRVHQSLSSKGIRITHEHLQEAMTNLTESFPLRFSRCYNCSRALLTTIVLVVLAVCSSIASVLTFSFTIPTYETSGIGAAWIIMMVIFAVSLLLSICLICWILKCRRLHIKPEHNANIHLMEHGIIVGLVKTQKMSCKHGIYFVHFRTSRCLRTLERYMKSRDLSKKKVLNIEDDAETHTLIDGSNEDDRRKEVARRHMAALCGRYVRLVNENKLYIPSTGIRHSRNGICLCQFVQLECFNEMV